MKKNYLIFPPNLGAVLKYAGINTGVAHISETSSVEEQKKLELWASCNDYW